MIASEIGPDFSAFPSAQHFCSWLALAPGTRISGGKNLPGKSPKAVNPVGQALRMAAMAARRSACGLAGGPGLTAAEVYDEIMVRSATFPLANGWRLARRRLMGADRIEIEGPADGDTAALKRMGCIAEIVSWRTRLFAPDIATLERIVERWPIAAPDA